MALTFMKPAESAAKGGPDALAALLAQRRALVMGILNVTPDSFSDGGQFYDADAAVGRAAAMASDGADLIDIGAESTRPYGSPEPVPADEELTRLRNVLPAVVRFGVPVSIDSNKAKVAAWALDQGAAIVNDVWGLQRDAGMAKLVAARGVPVIVMHNRDAAEPGIDIIAEVAAFFARQARRICPLRAAAAGRRLAQALHQCGNACRAGRAHRRLHRQPPRSGEKWRGDRARA
jgi:dihydropteroate synthase